MNLVVFSALFILQFVGHRIGDFILQTDVQAQNKTKDWKARLRHCFSYSLSVSLLTWILLPIHYLPIIFLITIVEHFIIDDRRFVVWLKTNIETKIAKQKEFNISTVPGFVIIEIDQTIHMIRMLLIAILFSYIM
ncbi:DUF3307 domain-containing protein [Paenibacillus sp. TCA20]|uniref:DUF3307 domain-containing protein n=1 Tax=Paenibacillus sp. TCA20 TaxID=1499968 RepID=UPI00064C4FB0|nr:DUF3307 domain-containing protein [Paenibacillus sp. TCA20]